LERNKFNIPEKRTEEYVFPFSQEQIESKVAEITKEIFGDEIKKR